MRRYAELRDLSRIALPLAAANLAEFAMFLSTKIIVGKLGFLQLAAVGLTADLTFEFAIVMMGFLSVAGVLIGHALGENQPEKAGRALNQALLLATLVGLPAVLFNWFLPDLMPWFGQSAQIIETARPYAHAQAFFVLPLLWFSVLRLFVTAMEDARVVLFITIGAVLVNFPLTLTLVHGYLGFPAMGVAGAGISISIVNLLMFLTLALHVSYRPRYAACRVWPLQWRIDAEIQKTLIRLGLPVAALVLLEAGLFVAVSILSGVLGTDELASYQVVMGWIGIPFVMAHAVASATMIRVAWYGGRKRPDGQREAGRTGMLAGLVMVAALMLVPLLAPDFIISIFLDPDDPGYQRISRMIRELLIFVVCFQIFDALQVVSAYALRGIRDTIVPLWIASLGYWIIGIGSGVLLAFGLNMGVKGLWIGLALGLTTTGLLLSRRFLKLTRQSVI